MKPWTQDIVLTHFDHHRLQGLLHVFRRRSAVNPWNLDALELELRRANTVEPHVVPFDVITMNSKVALQDLATGKLFSLTLVFPDAPAADAHTVAVLSLRGLALLGRRVGQIVEFSETGGQRDLLITKIEYQPEASGNYLM